MLTHNQIIHGDCIEVMRSLPNNTVDLVVTDPPYLVNYKDRSGCTIKNDNSLDMVLDSFQEIYSLLKPDTFCISFYGWNTVDIFFKAWKNAGFRPVGHITWSKNYSSHIGFLKAHHEQAYLLAKGRPRQPSNPITDVQPWEYSGNKHHPTEKAVNILKPLVKSFSKPSDLVLDPLLTPSLWTIRPCFSSTTIWLL